MYQIDAVGNGSHWACSVLKGPHSKGTPKGGSGQPLLLVAEGKT